MKVKICGLTNLEDALAACEYGADLVGFIFVEGTPRFVDPAAVKEIVGKLPDNVGRVGLFRDAALSEVKKNVSLCGLDHVQLHGDESPEYCAELKKILSDIKIIKTFKIKDVAPNIPEGAYKDADFYLFDTYHPEIMGGTGTRFNWEVLKNFRGTKPFFLAGGLTPENVAKAVKAVSPFGVDVASGVERSIGKKDKEKLKEFIQNAKKR